MKNDLIVQADLCVKCGLCLPHCPTYNLTLNENESPRGRIALIQAWAEQQLPGSKTLFEHVEHCLLCRACEKVCPAQVPYGHLMDNFRAQSQTEKLATGVKPGLTVKLLGQLLNSPSLTTIAFNSVKGYQNSGLQTISRFLRLPQLFGLKRLERLIEVKPVALAQDYFPAQGKVNGHVALFKGCMTEMLDAETLQAALQLLTAAGFQVTLPAGQMCCGALDAHAGNRQRAIHLAAKNNQAFMAQKFDAVVTLASGCGSHLQDYPASDFAHQVIDISQFLVQAGTLPAAFNALPGTVSVHSPCSLKNVMRAESWVGQLLRYIPDINPLPLPDHAHCCGSAGSYMLQYPGTAEALVQQLLSHIIPAQSQYLVTSNIGCAVHIRAALKAQGSAIEVLHPVALLARQMSQEVGV